MKGRLLLDLMKESAVMLILSILTALVFNHVSPKGIALVGKWDPSQGVITARSKQDAVLPEREIREVALAKRLFDQQEALFVDVRHPSVSGKGHIPGALLLPVHEREKWIDAFVEHYPVSCLIVVYCHGRECSDSHVVAQFLTDMGYERVKVFIDGYAGWENAGFPTEKEKQNDAVE
jgi:rhodanese-related sulfurtransferase